MISNLLKELLTSRTFNIIQQWDSINWRTNRWFE
jgi:hypothetical protein